MAKPKGPKDNSRTEQRPPPPPPPAPAPARVPPLFRKIDWLTMAITVVVVWITYFVTMAPELTLKDSGELVTGSYYAGIPHPPGYPVWSIYSWLWTVMLPVGNIAWRVAMGQTVSGALACGFIAIMVSRGSSMFMEGIEELKSMTGKWENAICMVSGLVAGLLVGFDSFMWSESIVVNRIAVFSVPWLMLVMLCLLRWIYAPHQLRYAYWAAFIFGVCLTTHQSLIVAAIGFEVAIAAGNPRLGRDAFLGNFILYIIYYLLPVFTGQHIFTNIEGKPGLFFLFNLIGVGSLITSIWLAVKTKGILSEWKPVLIMTGLWILGVSFYLYMPIAGMTNPPMQWGYPRTVEGFFHALSRGQYEQPNPTNVLAEPGRFAGQLGMLVGGVAEEFTWVFIFIALVPFAFFLKMQKRERVWMIALTAMYLCLGVLLMILLNPTPDRSSSDLIKVFLTSSHTIVAILIGYGLALIAAFMATHYEKFRRWGLMGGSVAVALALYSLVDSTGKLYFGPAGQVSLFELPHWIGQAFARNQYGLPIFASLVLVAIASTFVVALVAYRSRGPLLVTLCLFGAMPMYSVLDHWFNSEQHNHWFGYWFGHDMFTLPFKGADGKPLYPEMTKDAILFGGTDPGRFCPTYIIFCESFTPHKSQPLEDQKFDRRDVYIITQNALADGTYLEYIRAHYNKSAQVKYDTPFFQELVRSDRERQNYTTNLLSRLAHPLDDFFTKLGGRVEKRRRTSTSLFEESDFTNLPDFSSRLRSGAQQDPLSKYLFENLSRETQTLLAGQGNEAQLRHALAGDLNVLLERELKVKQAVTAKQQEKDEVDQQIAYGSTSDSLRRKQEQLAKEIAELSQTGSLYDTNRFAGVKLSDYVLSFIAQNPQSDTRIRLNRLLLEEAYPNSIARSLGGVYPDREIYIPSPEDSQICFNEYIADVQRRMQMNPPQIRGGEDVKVVRDPSSGQDRVQVAGQIAVMSINGLLTKVIFDHNPKNEFFVEESFPLDWMYPYLTPFGIIMKINRQPLPDLTEDILQRDHEFWSKYSERFIGNWITYDTSVKEIADFVEKVYLRRDFTGFKGDLKFVRDSDAQKSFSKLRSSIGGVYVWRLDPKCPAEYRPKTTEQAQRIFKEADFAFRQSFAFCPYSPEAVFRYAQLLTSVSRFDDALLVAETCLKLDPYNSSVIELLKNLQNYKKQQGAYDETRTNLQRLQAEVQQNPTNFQLAFSLAGAYLQMQQTNAVMQVLDRVLSEPSVGADAVIGVAQFYMKSGNWPKLEIALEKLVKITPDNADAWYDLAAMKASVGKPADSLQALGQALELSAKRLQHNPAASNLLAQARTEVRFNSIRGMPEFQKLVPPQ